MRSLEASEIIYYKVDVGRERPGILPCLFDSGFGNIDERNLPALLRQPDCVPSRSSRQIERTTSVRKKRPNEIRKSPRQKNIGVPRRSAPLGIFPVPALAFVIRSR